MAIKDGEAEKVKCYSAVCYSQRPLTPVDLENMAALEGIELQQKTPIRVLHR